MWGVKMMTKEDYLQHITERIPVEKFPTDWAGQKKWTYQEGTLAWDQVSIDGKRYMLTIENVDKENPPTTTQKFWWWYFTGPIDNPTGSVDVEEIPDDVAADSLEGMYNPPPLPQPPVEIPKEASITIIGLILGLMLRFGRR